LIPQYPNLPIRWARISYHWPNHPYPIKRDSLKIPMSNTGYVLEAKPLIMGVAHARLPHFALPMLYNSATPRRILERIKEKCGRLFLSTCPDISSGFAIAYESGRYLSMECPLTIAGISGKSNGIATTSAANMKVSQGRSQVAQEFMDLNRDHGMPLPHRSLPAIGIMPIGNASSFLYVQSKLFPNDRNYQLDANHLMKVCTEEICRRPMNEASELLAILREHVASQPNLTWVEPALAKMSKVEAVDPMTKPPPRGFDEQEKILAVDTSLFEVRDVHAASILAEKILAYQNRGFRLKIRTPRQNLVASGRKLLGDIVHRHKVPSFIDCD